MCLDMLAECNVLGHVGGMQCAWTCCLSEIETLTGEDATEKVEMALVQPITSREQIPERTLQERKLQNNVIMTIRVIPT